MTPQQHQALDKLESIHRNNPDIIALIITGSIAHKTARPDSDIDLYLVYNDEAYKKIEADKSYFYGTWDPADFFGVSIDGKRIPLRFLREAPARASEPTRASFRDAYALFSKDSEIPILIRDIAVYPEAEQPLRARAFLSYVKHHRYSAEEAFALGNEFWFRQCIVDLVFFSARLVLAHNRVLFPCHKALFAELDRCTRMPEGFIEMSHRLVASLTFDDMLAYYEKVYGYFSAYDYPDTERIGFILENEWRWFSGAVPPGDW